MGQYDVLNLFIYMHINNDGYFLNKLMPEISFKSIKFR